MVMMMASLVTGLIAKGILKASLIIEHLMNKTLVKESLKCPVNGYTIKGTADGVFNITMRQSIFFLNEQVENLLPGWSRPQLEVSKQMVGMAGHLF